MRAVIILCGLVVFWIGCHLGINPPGIAVAIVGLVMMGSFLAAGVCAVGQGPQIIEDDDDAPTVDTVEMLYCTRCGHQFVQTDEMTMFTDKLGYMSVGCPMCRELVRAGLGERRRSA